MRRVVVWLVVLAVAGCGRVESADEVEVRFGVEAGVTKAVAAEGVVELRVVGLNVDADVLVRTGQSVRLKVGRYRVIGEYEPDWGSVEGVRFGDGAWYGVDDEVSVVKGKSAYVLSGQWRCWALVLGEGSAEYRCNRAPIGMSGGVCYVPEGEADWTLTVVPEDDEVWDVTDVAVVSGQMESGRRYVFRAGRLEQEVEGFSVEMPEWKE